jgi:hypothetical protein
MKKEMPPIGILATQPNGRCPSTLSLKTDKLISTVDACVVPIGVIFQFHILETI